jgi:hypothetical protein
MNLITQEVLNIAKKIQEKKRNEKTIVKFIRQYTIINFD